MSYSLMKTIEIEHPLFKIGGLNPFCLIAGPCVLEEGENGDKMHHQVAMELVRIREELKIPVVFKASFDKANRSSSRSYRGMTLERSIDIFNQIKKEYQLPVISDVHEVKHVELMKNVLDILQIPAFLSRQTDLIQEAALTKKIVMIKKGQFISPHDVEPLIDKFYSQNNRQLILCDRGYTFGYNRLINDFGGLWAMRQFQAPICFDVTHSVQEPGAAKTQSGGHPEEIPALARAAVAVGIDALFMEVHPEPRLAKSDASTVFPLSQLYSFVQGLIQLDSMVKGY